MPASQAVVLRTVFDRLQTTLMRPVLLATLKACPSFYLVDDVNELVFRDEKLASICEEFGVDRKQIAPAARAIFGVVQYCMKELGVTRTQIIDETRHTESASHEILHLSERKNGAKGGGEHCVMETHVANQETSKQHEESEEGAVYAAEATKEGEGEGTDEESVTSRLGGFYLFRNAVLRCLRRCGKDSLLTGNSLEGNIEASFGPPGLQHVRRLILVEFVHTMASYGKLWRAMKVAATAIMFYDCLSIVCKSQKIIHAHLGPVQSIEFLKTATSEKIYTSLIYQYHDNFMSVAHHFG
ncbi:hypothetical protein B0H19DRAFT_1080465 [Mycena capillaripes]|nr:hypothetical protein B0H19DRAFT_1080465 [Mycena capillaripes]